MSSNAGKKTGGSNRNKARSRAATFMIALLVLLMVAGGGSWAYFAMGGKSAEELYQSGKNAFEAGDYAAAAGQFEQAIKKDPMADGYDMLGMALGYQYAQEKKPELQQKEIDAFKHAVALKPDDPVSLLNLGTALYNADRLTEGAPYLERVLAVQPDHPDKAAIEEMLNKAKSQS